MTEDSSTVMTELLRHARNGEDQALATLLESYRDYLRLLARVQINKRWQGRVSPSDVVQDAFLKAQKAFGGFRGESEIELTAWLRRILASQLVSTARYQLAECRDVRMERRIDQAIEDSSIALAQCLPANQTSPSNQVAKREQAVLLTAALAKLPEDYREVIVLRHLESKSFADVAELMGKTVPSVKSIWTRAITKLRSALRDAS